jgi:biotin-(acetyl-CoA carboxylase) ligase
LDSTNAMALREFREFADGTLLTAGEQTAGIGRRGRVWISPPNTNLYATYIVKKPVFPPGDAMLMGGLAALDALRKFAPSVKWWLKWPNDICCGPVAGMEWPENADAETAGDGVENISRKPNIPRSLTLGEPESNGVAIAEERGVSVAGTASAKHGFKKIAGLLAQTHSPSNSNKVDGVALGIGVNLNMSVDQLSRIGRPAASIFSETGKTVDPAEFAVFLLEMLSRYREKAENDPEALFGQWRDANALIGERIELRLENGDSFSGKVADIHRNGGLVVEDGDGSERIFVAGDILPAL